MTYLEWLWNLLTLLVLGIATLVAYAAYLAKARPQEVRVLR